MFMSGYLLKDLLLLLVLFVFGMFIGYVVVKMVGVFICWFICYIVVFNLEKRGGEKVL